MTPQVVWRVLDPRAPSPWPPRETSIVLLYPSNYIYAYKLINKATTRDHMELGRNTNKKLMWKSIVMYWYYRLPGLDCQAV